MVQLTDLPWLAIVVGAVVAFVLGGLWYSPLLFAKQWAVLAYPGRTMEDLQKDSKPILYVLAGVGWLVAAATLGWFAAATGHSGDLLGSLRVGLYAALGLLLPAYASTYAFGGKPWALFGIDWGYQALGLALVGLAIGLLG